MEQIRSYLISVVCTALICGIAGKLFSSKGASETVIKMIAGLVMTISMLQPIVGLDFSQLTNTFQIHEKDAESMILDAKEQSRKTLKSGIKERTEAYILDKAREMKADISVRVDVSDDELPVPKAVYISGDVSPFVKSKLQSVIANDLEISKGNQKWT